MTTYPNKMERWWWGRSESKRLIWVTCRTCAAFELTKHFQTYPRPPSEWQQWVLDGCPGNFHLGASLSVVSEDCPIHSSVGA